MTDVKDQTSPQIEVRNLKTYFYTEDGVVRAVDGLSYRLAKGETLEVIRPELSRTRAGFSELGDLEKAQERLREKV